MTTCIVCGWLGDWPECTTCGEAAWLVDAEESPELVGDLGLARPSVEHAARAGEPEAA